MSDRGVDDLDRDDWDYSRAESRPSGSSPRAVVSVAFPRADFDAVSEFARSNDMKVSEFIREAAIEQAAGQRTGTLLHGTGSVGTAWWSDRTPVTRVRGDGLSVNPLAEPAAATYG